MRHQLFVTKGTDGDKKIPEESINTAIIYHNLVQPYFT